MLAHLVLICTVKLLTGWSYLKDLCLHEKLSGISLASVRERAMWGDLHRSPLEPKSSQSWP